VCSGGYLVFLASDCPLLACRGTWAEGAATCAADYVLVVTFKRVGRCLARDFSGVAGMVLTIVRAEVKKWRQKI
jgi:hypothetical protein